MVFLYESLTRTIKEKLEKHDFSSSVGSNKITIVLYFQTLSLLLKSWQC